MRKSKVFNCFMRKIKRFLRIDLSHSNLSFLSVLSEYSLESELLICQKLSKLIMDYSEVSLSKAYNINIMPWELEMVSAYSVYYYNPSSTKCIDSDTFSYIVTKLRNYWDSNLITAYNQGLFGDSFLMISYQQQVLTQGIFLQKLFRYHYFFYFKNSKIDMNELFKNEIGIQYQQFEIFAFILFVCFADEKTENVNILKKLFINESEIIETLSIDVDKYKEKLSEINVNNVAELYYGFKLQYIYPFICTKEFKYIPCPFLIINAVTESMLNRLTYGNNKLRKAFGKNVLERYLFDILSQLSSVTWISGEISYRIRHSNLLSSDVIAAEGANVCFCDTKSLSPSLKIRKFDQKEIEKNIDLYADGIYQIYKQIKNYRKGFFSLDKKYEDENVYGILVVLEESGIPREKVYLKVKSIIIDKEKEDNDPKRTMDYIHSHIKVISLKQVENFALNNFSLLHQLIAQKDTPQKWNNFSYSFDNIPTDSIPMYKEYVDNIKSSVTAYLDNSSKN